MPLRVMDLELEITKQLGFSYHSCCSTVVIQSQLILKQLYRDQERHEPGHTSAVYAFEQCVSEVPPTLEVNIFQLAPAFA